MVTSKQAIDIPHPIYDTIDKAVDSPDVISCKTTTLFIIRIQTQLGNTW